MLPQNEHTQTIQIEEVRKQLIEAIIAYVVFCGIGFSSRFVPIMFLFFIMFGIAFPLAWAIYTHHWSAIGFSKKNFRKSLVWGIMAGVAWGVYTYIAFGIDKTLPPLWALQVTISVPVWFLIMSPFQEFFFRGWLQPRLQSAFGKLVGLFITSSLFTIRHFFPQLEGTSTSLLPIGSPLGIFSTVLAGFLFGYIYQRAENIIAPWVAHALGGIVLVLIGMMSFIQYTP